MCRNVLIFTTLAGMLVCILFTTGQHDITLSDHTSQVDAQVTRHAIPMKPHAYEGSPAPMYRYDRSVRAGDTTYVYHATPAKGFVFCYVYLNSRLSHINVYDYLGETQENFLDFLPIFYQIAIPGGK